MGFFQQQCLFTLLFGFLVIWGVEKIRQKFVADVYGEKAAAIRVILTIVTVAAGDFWHFFSVQITICREL